MPRNRFRAGPLAVEPQVNLIGDLTAELRSTREVGQPTINEEEFGTGVLRVNVFWDRWEEVPADERGEQIMAAYREVMGDSFVDKIGLLGGYTFPEAVALGLLPYQVIPLVRKGDPVTVEQCRQAMLDAGASTLFPGHKTQLRFATPGQAEVGRNQLVKSLPASEPVWTIVKDVGTIEDFPH